MGCGQKDRAVGAMRDDGVKNVGRAVSRHQHFTMHLFPDAYLGCISQPVSGADYGIIKQSARLYLSFIALVHSASVQCCERGVTVLKQCSFISWFNAVAESPVESLGC